MDEKYDGKEPFETGYTWKDYENNSRLK